MNLSYLKYYKNLEITYQGPLNCKQAMKRAFEESLKGKIRAKGAEWGLETWNLLKGKPAIDVSCTGLQYFRKRTYRSITLQMRIT